MHIKLYSIAIALTFALTSCAMDINRLLNHDEQEQNFVWHYNEIPEQMDYEPLFNEQNNQGRTSEEVSDSTEENGLEESAQKRRKYSNFEVDDVLTANILTELPAVNTVDPMNQLDDNFASTILTTLQQSCDTIDTQKQTNFKKRKNNGPNFIFICPSCKEKIRSFGTLYSSFKVKIDNHYVRNPKCKKPSNEEIMNKATKDNHPVSRIIAIAQFTNAGSEKMLAVAPIKETKPVTVDQKSESKNKIKNKATAKSRKLHFTCECGQPFNHTGSMDLFVHTIKRHYTNPRIHNMSEETFGTKILPQLELYIQINNQK